jgi:hypothetical protein
MCLILETAFRMLKFDVVGLHEQLSGEFHFSLYGTNITHALHEVKNPTSSMFT